MHRPVERMVRKVFVIKDDISNDLFCFILTVGGPVVRSAMEREAWASSARELVDKRRCIEAETGKKIVYLEHENFNQSIFVVGVLDMRRPVEHGARTGSSVERQKCAEAGEKIVY